MVAYIGARGDEEAEEEPNIVKNFAGDEEKANTCKTSENYVGNIAQYGVDGIHCCSQEMC